MHIIDEIHEKLQTEALHNPTNPLRFFKTNPGDYAAHDRFIGLTVPFIRITAKQYSTISYNEIKALIQSPFNEERLLALLIMVTQYQKGDVTIKQELFELYLNIIKQINNWNLVDSSAHLIVGAHLYGKSDELLISLAHSSSLWERRIAIVATWYAIKKNDCALTFQIASLLLGDTHDLIHKATGWMLREAGKRNPDALIHYVDAHATTMPRTMLRYALERFSPDIRKHYMSKKV